jgi:pimeloyl-ACP methyl ester carboxylesterase
MKKMLLFVFTVLISLNTYGQEITGQWNGLLKVPGQQLRVVFNISKPDSGYTATMDSPDQGAKGIPVTSVSFENLVLKLAVKNLFIEYEGVLGKDNIVAGNFKQAAQSFPMNLSREMPAKETIVRPQEPAKPYPYYSEEVSFENKKDKIVLAGTLTLPKKEGSFPAVVLITGSGPQNRDEELCGHKPFLVISDYLTKKGIAVLRFDDRGTGESKGDFNTATTLDFATDVEAAVNYLKTRNEINFNKIGLIGHSEGGMIAPIVASRSKDISFIVLLAGPGISGDKLLLLQKELIERAAGVSEKEIQKGRQINKGAFDIVEKSADMEKLKAGLVTYFKPKVKEFPDFKTFGMSEENYLNITVSQLANPWMKFFIGYNPAAILKNVKCPVLALDGEKDLQVPAKVNLAAIKKAFKKSGNKKVVIKELPGLNHLFQECETGLPDEYAKIEQTISPKVLTEISIWISKIQN